MPFRMAAGKWTCVPAEPVPVGSEIYDTGLTVFSSAGLLLPYYAELSVSVRWG